MDLIHVLPLLGYEANQMIINIYNVWNKKINKTTDCNTFKNYIKDIIKL